MTAFLKKKWYELSRGARLSLLGALILCLGLFAYAIDSDIDGISDSDETNVFGTDPNNTFDAPGRRMKLDGGSDHTIGIAEGGLVWAWGRNIAGQLGIGGTNACAPTPVMVHGSGNIDFLTNMVSIAGGAVHSVAACSDGTAWCWGSTNGGCRMGDNTTTNRTSPVQVHGTNNLGYLQDVVAVAAGDAHSLALTEQCFAYAWGYNAKGQLGDATTTTRNTPVLVLAVSGSGGLSNLVAIAAGSAHNVALDSLGKTYAWGNNASGQIGDNSTTTRTRPVQIKGTNAVGYLTNVMAIAAGSTHSLAVKLDGTVYAWGNNTCGQLGDNTITNRLSPVKVRGAGGTGYLSNIVAVVAGSSNSLALMADGTVWAWGAGTYGKLGNNSTVTTNKTPVQVHGTNDIGYLSNIVAIAAGLQHCAALRNDGAVFAWGRNAYGQLGDGTTTDRYVPVEVTFSEDIDADGLPDDWEYVRFGNLNQTSGDDPDNDGLTNLQEYHNGTDPNKTDTDGDGMPDKWEVDHNLNPLVNDASLDPDNDGLTNLQEYQNGTDPHNSDTDNDGMSDGTEVRFGFDPTIANAFWRTDVNWTTNQWTTGFEASEGYIIGQLNGQDLWHATTNALVVTNDVFSGTQSALLPGSGVSNNPASMNGDIGANGRQQAWITLYAKLYQGYPRKATTSETWAVMMYMRHNRLLAYDGVTKTWMSSQTFTNLATNAWVRYDIGINYSNKQYLVCVNGALAVRNVGFKTADLRDFSAFKVTGSILASNADTRVDAVRISAVEPASELDFDSDGLPNDWEYAHGTDPYVNDANADPDQDGLTNIEEYRLGTDPLNPDTDGDGLSDGAEVKELGTNPLAADGNGTTTTVTVKNGSDISASSGIWQVVGTEIRCNSTAGWVEYTIQCPSTDMYKLTVEATHIIRYSYCTPVEPIGQSSLILYTDGQLLGRRTLTAPDGIYGKVDIFTQYLQAGTHTVRVRWDNSHDHVSLKIKSLTVQQVAGNDSNSNGTKDWIEQSLSTVNRLDAMHAGTSSTNITSQSCVSPVCLEGPVRGIDRMSVSSGGVSNAVHHGVGDRWSADAALSQAGATPIAISFENGAFTLATNITWTALNLLSSQNQLIRKGDALKLTAWPGDDTNGTVTIAIAGLTNYVTTFDQPVIHQFTNAGTYTVTGTWQGSSTLSGTATVTVMAASFPTNVPDFLIGSPRTWQLPDVPANAVLEADSTVTLGRQADAVDITMSNVTLDHYMTARVATNGAIMADSKLNGFWVQGAVDNQLWVVADYGDSQLWETTLVVKNLPADVSILITLFVPGVTFEDMTTERWLTAADFNEAGEYRMRAIHPNSAGPTACHTITMYQKGVYLGEAYYSGVLMPEE